MDASLPKSRRVMDTPPGLQWRKGANRSPTLIHLVGAQILISGVGLAYMASPSPDLDCCRGPAGRLGAASGRKGGSSLGNSCPWGGPASKPKLRVGMQLMQPLYQLDRDPPYCPHHVLGEGSLRESRGQSQEHPGWEGCGGSWQAAANMLPMVTWGCHCRPTK